MVDVWYTGDHSADDHMAHDTADHSGSVDKPRGTALDRARTRCHSLEDSGCGCIGSHTGDYKAGTGWCRAPCSDDHRRAFDHSRPCSRRVVARRNTFHRTRNTGDRSPTELDMAPCMESPHLAGNICNQRLQYDTTRYTVCQKKTIHSTFDHKFDKH